MLPTMSTKVGKKGDFQLHFYLYLYRMISSIFLQIMLMAASKQYSFHEYNRKYVIETKLDTTMNEIIFWKMMEKICQMGDFIAATGKDGASANIKGKFVVGYDGKEKVIENTHHDHIHLYTQQISRFNFTHIDAGYGNEPCIEIINIKNEIALKLFYFGSSKNEKYAAFLSTFIDYQNLITGKW